MSLACFEPVEEAHQDTDAPMVNYVNRSSEEITPVVNLDKRVSTHDWQWLLPAPQPYFLRGVAAISEQSAVAVGDYGTIVFTDDAGSTWRVVQSQTDSTLRAVHFIDKNTGWIVGDEALLQSTNGGRSWSLVNNNSSLGGRDIFFLNEKRGWIASTNRVYFETNDGGLRWQKKRVAEEVQYDLVTLPPVLTSIYFVDDDFGWASAGVIRSGRNEGTVYATTDGGKSWKTVLDGNVAISDVRFLDRLEGYILGMSGVGVSKATDGGLTWDHLGNDARARDMLFSEITGRWTHTTSNLVGQLAFGEHDTLIVAEDFLRRGEGSPVTWTHAESIRHITAIDLLDNTIGWAVGKNGELYRTEDGARSWQAKHVGALNPSSRREMAALHFFDDMHGWILGTERLARTQDGGASWQELEGIRNISAFKEANAMQFVGDHGWVVGPWGIIRTKDRGDTWHAYSFADEAVIQSYGAASPWAMHFVDEHNGWIVGGTPIVRVDSSVVNEATILSTRDGGQTWQVQRSGLAGCAGNLLTPPGTFPLCWQRLLAVHFVDAQRGWAAGVDGALIQTTNGGTTWENIGTGTDHIVSAVHFFTAHEGLFYGIDKSSDSEHGAAIYRTTDGGRSWHKQADLPHTTLRWTGDASYNSLDGECFPGHFHFFDDEHGWLVSDRAYRTFDGGRNWEEVPTPPYAGVRALHGPNSEHTFASGERGAVLKYSP